MFLEKEKELVVLTGCQNIKKREKYKATILKVLYIITICINETNKQYIKDFKDIKSKQEGLYTKYSKKTLQVTYKYIRKITIFLLKQDITVKDIQTKLKEL